MKISPKIHSFHSGDGPLISAIDIGSNAIRMMVAQIQGDQFRVIKKFRSAIRLGAEVFQDGVISRENMQRVKKTFEEFSEVNRSLKVQRCRAIATSATREAKNAPDFVKFLAATGINVEVISGDLEAKMLFKAVSHEVDLERSKALLIDIGGGSLEVTHVEKGQILSSQSFPVGTVRLLDELRRRKLNEANLKILMGDFLLPLLNFFDKSVSHSPLDFAVGTGGNFEAMSHLKKHLLHKAPAQSLSLQEVSQLANRIKPMSMKDRIQKLKIRSDRADVIIPALFLVETVLRQANCSKVLVPKVGLRDGIILSMMEELKPAVKSEVPK
ncbi:MAG: hypothetical protein V4736_03330 [Bdellovibrionota bacterium]